MKTLTIIESPFAGNIPENIAYARKCVADSLARGEAPIASHLLHPQLLDDNDPAQRQLGIDAGLAWYRVADKCAVYMDRGESSGMRTGIACAHLYGVPVEVRTIERGVRPKKIVLLCADCGEPQFDTPSGVTCCNGHGGADSIEQEVAA